jgi:hypothetical protein
MKTLAAAFALALATCALAAAPEKAIVLPSKTGAVTFNHKSHAALKCTQCHADEKGGPIAGMGKPPIDKDKAHAACHECHKKEGKGPTKCADCHKKG